MITRSLRPILDKSFAPEMDKPYLLPEGNTVEDWYLEFDINDDLMFDLPEGGQVHIEIEHLDQGSELDLTNNWFNIHYDAHSGGQYGDGRFMDSEIIEFQDTGEYISSVFILQDAQFANRNNGADFRLNPGDGSITILRVFVTYFPPGMDPRILLVYLRVRNSLCWVKRL